MGLLKTVFHVHTHYSDDANVSVQDLLAEARARNVQCLAVTDHDTIEGAQELASRCGPELRVIIGEEVSTRDGHLIGLFLQEHIPAGLSARRTAELIRSQEGLVIAPHPFNRLFGCSLRDRIHTLWGVLDAIEICNAQNLLPFADRRAAELARTHQMPQIVGVDVHHRDYLDSCYQVIPAFDDAGGFLASLRQAAFVLDHHPLSYFLQSARVAACSRLGLRPPAGYGERCSTPRRPVPVEAPQLPTPAPAE